MRSQGAGMGISDRLTTLADRLRARSSRDAVPVSDSAVLAPVARRARLVRLGLAAALVACGLAAVTAVPDPEDRRLLPSNSANIVVVDLSSSIRPKSFELIRQTLRALIATNSRFGVVLFSDVAYVALPPQTPARELVAFVRFFEPNRPTQSPDGTPVARTPWEQWFSAGTSISSGLLLAADVLEQNRIQDGGVVLFSDLADDPSDLQRLAEAIALYAEQRIPLRVIALDPAPENRDFFRELLGSPGVLSDVALPEIREGRRELAIEASFPTWLAVLGVGVVVLLALNEWFCEPLRWPRRPRA
jgi:hypothetical protein